MPQRVAGLDLGSASVKAVLLESTFRGHAVLDAASVPVAPDGEGQPGLRERQVAALQGLLASRGWHFDAAVAAWPGAGAASHLVALPFSDPRRIAETVQFEVEGQIPFDLSEVAWDWQVLETRAGRTDLYVGVVRREEMKALLGHLAGVGIDPRVVLPAGPAYAALPAAGALRAGEAGEGAAGAEVILDVGAERVSACVVASGQCLWARTFPGGTAALARTLARDLGLPEEAARRLLEAECAGSPAPPELAAAAADPRAAESLRRGLSSLVRELRATLKSWEARGARRPLRRLRLCGGAARLPGLADLLSAEVGAPAEPLALSGPGAERIPEAEAPGYALALALALRGHLGARAGRLNLRRGDLASTRDFEHLRGRLARLAVYAGLVLLLALGSATARTVALSRQERLLDRSLCEVTQQVTGKCYEDFSVAESVLRGRGTPAAAVPRLSAVTVLAELAARTPEVPLKLDRIEITREKLHLQGSTDSAENVDKVVEGLRASRCFAEARSGGVRKRGSDARFEFTIDSDLACEGAPAAAAGKAAP
ncbi:MAG TPA: pilus assembly protein PilM [Anaeromyxobacteraceae bacterium]|nr:pilus assembly protein PilM [Anaeromyxobacteraceae bacterium]